MLFPDLFPVWNERHINVANWGGFHRPSVFLCFALSFAPSSVKVKAGRCTLMRQQCSRRTVKCSRWVEVASCGRSQSHLQLLWVTRYSYLISEMKSSCRVLIFLRETWTLFCVLSLHLNQERFPLLLPNRSWCTEITRTPRYLRQL